MYNFRHRRGPCAHLCKYMPSHFPFLSKFIQFTTTIIGTLQNQGLLAPYLFSFHVPTKKKKKNKGKERKEREKKKELDFIEAVALSCPYICYPSFSSDFDSQKSKVWQVWFPNWDIDCYLCLSHEERDSIYHPTLLHVLLSWFSIHNVIHVITYLETIFLLINIAIGFICMHWNYIGS